MEVSIVLVRMLAGAVERAGGSRDRFLAQADIDPRWIEDGSMRLPAAHYGRALDAALAVSGDPALGLRIGEQLRPMMFDIVGPLLEHTATLRELFDVLGRYSRLLAPGQPPMLKERDDSAWFRFPVLPDVPAMRMTTEFVMTSFLRALQLFVGDDARPRLVSFAHQEPPYVAEYTRIFGDAVRFGAARTQMEIPRAWLDKRQTYRSAEVYAALAAHADKTLDRLEREGSLRARIERVLAERGLRESTMKDVARALDTSARSLRRGLQAEGVSFGALRTQHQIREAKRLLGRPNASMKETAYALGFDSPIAFNRAFKRWTGMTPKQYRDAG